VRDLDDAEDVVQTASLNAYRAFDRFRLDRPFGPWFLTIVANEARTCWRARGRSVALGRRAAAEMVLADAQERRPYDFRAQLAAALASLSPAHREIVICRYFLGLSEQETARRLELPQGTVKSRHSRAIDRLRLELSLRGVIAA
jgi:RNA polymerase sigma factor (sigma-70 family)